MINERFIVHNEEEKDKKTAELMNEGYKVFIMDCESQGHKWWVIRAKKSMLSRLKG